MQVTVLAGGIGAARFLGGLIEVVESTESAPTITVIGNTGDDIRLFGLQVCPDLDSVMYTLGGGASVERGWGREDESFTVLEELRAYGAKPEWFGLGDRDFATHILRSQMLTGGYPLSAVTAALCQRWRLPVALLPMSDDRIETHVVVDDPETGEPTALHFQEWWVRHHAALAASEFIMIGADDATPAPGVIDAIMAADLLVLPPSNPVVSIGPILAVPGIRAAVRRTSAPVVGVSPIVGGAPVRGMADACLTAIGVPTTALGVAQHYGSRAGDGVLDGWIVDDADAAAVASVEALGIAAQSMNTIFDDPKIATEVARALITLGEQVRVT
ncbi:MAG: 2-phospho-L-lactate transferase [Candidatus Nanopelagicales bacterium]